MNPSLNRLISGMRYSVNILLVSLAILVGLLIVLEVGLRWLLGMGNPLLYLADEEIGYLLAPNQRMRRFGNRILINDYSMRSPAITRTRPVSTLRVMLLGDSIANGASWTDQERTISARMSTELERLVQQASGQGLLLQTPFERVEVMNASANSWGPQNELAYLKRFGTFEAQAVVLLLNTDDLFAAAPTSEKVGRDLNYPNRKPSSALAEVLNRYLLPRIPRLTIKAVFTGVRGIFTQEATTLKPVEFAQTKISVSRDELLVSNLDAIRQIHALVVSTDAQFLLAMTPLLREIGEPEPRDDELQARQHLTQLTQDQHISYLDFLPMFNGWETPHRWYRDHIHLSPQGNQAVSEAIAHSLQQLLRLSATSVQE
ncbi:MAG TPA: GDSL-type esterase/lipase family protein [Waterburya sp.]|jgi:hypothetical protein